MKDIEEINSYDDIETYYDVQIPEFIQTILENRVEALKHCVNYKKENERLHSIIKEVREYIEKHIAMFKNGDMLVDMNIDELLEILEKDKQC